MKKIIGGKQYNTDTGTTVGSNFASIKGDSCFEVLYMTRRKDYFVYGSGPIETRWKGRPGIIAVDIDAAIYWLKSNRFKVRNKKGVLHAVKKTP